MRALVATLAVLASQAGDPSCETQGRAGYDCHVDTRGLRHENGLVVDVVTHWCDPAPRRLAFTAWIEARRGAGDEWVQVGRSATQFIPAGPKGKKLRVEGGRCQPDVEYSTAWSSEGVDSKGVPFRVKPDSDLFGTTGLC